MLSARDVPVQLAVIEWRRISLLFFDYRGRIAAELAAEFEGVSFNMPIVSGETPIFAEGLQITVPGTRRAGVVDGRQVRFQEEAPKDIAAFAQDAIRFIHTADRLTHPDQYERLGMLFVFVGRTIPEPGISLKEIDGDLPPGWSVDNIAVRASTLTDKWAVTGTVNTTIERDSDNLNYLVREVSIDQYQWVVDKEKALSVDLIDVHERAQMLRSEITRGAAKDDNVE